MTTTSKIAAPLSQTSVNASEVGLAQQNKTTLVNNSLKVASQTKTGLDGYSTTPSGDHLESLVSSTTQQLPSMDIVGGADFKSDIKSPLTNATAKQQIQQLTNSSSTTTITTATTNATTPASAIVTPIGVNSDGLLASNHTITNSRHTTTAPVNHLMNNATNTNGSSLIASNLVLASVQQQQQQPMYGSQQGNAKQLIQFETRFNVIFLIECKIMNFNVKLCILMQNYAF